jgi:beta-xylosidase
MLFASGACGSKGSGETASASGQPSSGENGGAGMPSSGVAGSALDALAGWGSGIASGEAGSSGGNASGAAGSSASLAGAGTAAGSAGTSAAGTSGAGAVDGPWPPSATFSNPILWQDLPDDEIIRVDDVFYYTASNMHYSPGAPILRSWDLVNWEFIGHAVPVLDFGAKYDLSGGQAYIKGTWASSLNYRKSNQTFYFLACIEFSKTYIYTAPAAEGPWQKKSTINNCYYDAGMMVDYDDSADDTMYVAFGGGGDISVAQLSPDGLSQVKAQQVFTTNGSYSLEGSHFFKYKNNYYITPTRPADGEFVLKSSNVWGPYTSKALIDKTKGPVAGGGVPHQGSLIQTKKGDWYYMGFQDAYPGGRIPVLAPITWSADGWPTVQLVNNAWGASYPYPDLPRPPRATKPHTGKDTFSGTALAPEWEWNHNPDNTKWSINNGVTLQTATVTSDLYSARNTLTRRTIGPQSTATVQIDISTMKDGDVAGLALLKHMSAYVGIKKSGGSCKVTMVNGLTMSGSWATTSTGSEAASSPISGTKIWLRATADVRPGAGRQAKFSYSADGVTFTSIGPAYTLNTDWQFFPGYRYGIFNFATAALGGSVTVKSFELTVP